MITVTPIVEPIEIECPHCGTDLKRVTEHDELMLVGDTFIEDGDLIPVSGMLTPEEKEGMWFACALEVGHGVCCKKNYVGVRLLMVQGQPDNEFVETFVFKRKDPGQATNYAVSRPDLGLEWVLTKYQSRLGPVHEHWLGPVAWEDTSWIGEQGVSTHDAHPDREPWKHSAMTVLGLWDDLRTLLLSE